MALAIKSIPVLYGDAAERFEEEAEANSKNPVPSLSKEEKTKLDNFIAKSRNFVF